MTPPRTSPADALRELAALPRAAWARELARRFPDDTALAQQALLWLHADHAAAASADDRPSLGPVGDERYELGHELDAGATSSVWQAYDKKLGRDVAIKFFHRRGAPALSQLLAEARAACDVISDHVVRILDVHDDTAHPYIVMELVGEHDPERGQLVLGSSASTCRPDSVAEVVRWVMRIARGVHDAHLRNVFHRDLKPDNVLITPLSRRARIADFGLAVSLAEQEHPRAASLVLRSACGPITVSGTPEYMAPEQARGLPLQLDPRVVEDRARLVAIDVWGIGALAYDLLAGAPPWLCAGDREPWEVAASGDRPAPLSRTSWGERIPRRLRRIVDRSLSLDPRQRYATAADLADELEAFAARRPTTFDRARHVRVGLWCRRNPQLALAGVVATALISLTLATRATVERLRSERDALDHEVATQEDELSRLERSVEQTRAELARTKLRLKQEGLDLDALEALLARERASHDALLAAKDAALAEASATARELAARFEAMRAVADARERELAATTKDVAQIRSDREKARATNDQLRRQRDTMQAELDAARHALSTLEHELAGASPDHSSRHADRSERSEGVAQ